MVGDVHAALLGGALSEASRAQLNAWLLSGDIDDIVPKAGLPQGWRVGDKSGSGAHATRNAIGIIYPPQPAPIPAAVFLTETTQPLAAREKLIADAGQIITPAFSE